MASPEDINKTEMKLKRIAALSAANPDMVFTHVIHHINEESLLACFHELDRRKAIGIDGVDKRSYGEKLNENLRNLVDRMRRMAYIPGPVRQVLIPKDGKPDATRPLGISNFEDKLVQRAMHKILESIYEPLFHEHSYGFRPVKSCHDAIEDLHAHLSTLEVETVLDVDLSNYFRRQQRQGIKQETFDFLGFTFYLGKSRKGFYLVKLKTIGKRLNLKLKKTNDWARSIRNKTTLKQIMKTAASKTKGHIQYYGVSHNFQTVNNFVYKVKKILFKWLNRRSQRKSFNWEQFQKYLDRIKPPEARICHKLF
jgi:retron-type reverse transcriptase